MEESDGEREGKKGFCQFSVRKKKQMRLERNQKKGMSQWSRSRNSLTGPSRRLPKLGFHFRLFSIPFLLGF
ncbi:hypothetical protein PanWU01x14_030510 [Parasponia andersonii]|uniref:Uncharacterized protein n=1 Tax=Parasponia andersonii TaxID=3476 RepID=A0A2P5DUS2_PARAD|nr:hypothetical protein PanWU01x14_030510 [Parasponia andersonii]